MIMAGLFSGRNAQAMMRASNSAVLFVTLLVPYAAGKDWTRESNGIVGRSIYCYVGCELLRAVIVTLVAACARVGGWGWQGGGIHVV